MAPRRTKATCEVKRPPLQVYRRKESGTIYLGDALDLFRNEISPGTVDLIVTSPPFGLVRKKDYGNVDAHKYLEWFRPFGEAFKKALKPKGSLVIDIGGAWIPGQPTRSLYHYELLVMLCREVGFHLAQDFFWWSPSKLPTPAEWVTVRRIRVKDAVNCIWWLSPTPWPKASNRRVLLPYSDSMKHLLKNGYKAQRRPSGHDISAKFSTDNGAAIPPNLIALPNTESNSFYLRYCKEHEIKPHPARFPVELPQYFIRMLTDPGDLVVDPFAGSCASGEAADRLDRRWVCCELVESYLRGALGRFEDARDCHQKHLFKSCPARRQDGDEMSYKLHHPSAGWTHQHEFGPLPADGGEARPPTGRSNGR
ncbi:MAG: site-specific DNA-methyltransferase [Planctomycetia bacterium]|nr:site-specific DNA-methyltransferase [Planctomycetia bacterium]